MGSVLPFGKVVEAADKSSLEKQKPSWRTYVGASSNTKALKLFFWRQSEHTKKFTENDE
jgi:hypothetical protein